MELILVKPLRKVGKIGDKIKVKNGYGRNFLIPKNFAIRATEKNKEFFDQQRQILEEKNHKLYLQSKEVASLLEDKELVFVRQAAEDGKLFGSVSNKEIATNLSELAGVNITFSQIYLQNVIKYIGLYNVEVVLHAEKIVNIKLAVGRTEVEARSLLTSSRDSNSEMDQLGKEVPRSIDVVIENDSIYK